MERDKDFRISNNTRHKRRDTWLSQLQESQEEKLRREAERKLNKKKKK